MPQIIVMSDIHANLEALEAVLAHAQTSHGVADQLWCLGDLVGYGPDPGPCIDLLRAPLSILGGGRALCIRGNHDEGVLRAAQGQEHPDTYAQVVQGWRWTAKQLTEEQRSFLAGLPTSATPTGAAQTARLVHGAPPDSTEEYLHVADDVEAVLPNFAERICLFGHTHLACYFETDQRSEVRPRLFPTAMDQPLELQGYARLLLNPGAVGQPRWGRLVPWEANRQAGSYPLNCRGVPAASYLWLEIHTDRVRAWCHYVPYDTAQTVRKLDALSGEFVVPQRWKDRLSEGLR
jgi:predicted phosphodiesterase